MPVADYDVMLLNAQELILETLTFTLRLSHEKK